MERSPRIILAACLIVAGCSSGQPGSDKSAKGAANDPGQLLFEKHCSSCHGTGIGNPGFSKKTGTAALEAKYKGQLPSLLEDRTDLTPDLIKYVVRNGVTVMAPYRKTEISDSELEQIAAYLSKPKPSADHTL